MAKATKEIEVPANNPVIRKPTAKKEFSLNDFKKKIGGEDIPDKPMRWIYCSDALKNAVGNSSLPLGYVSLLRGYTNTGKSTGLECVIVSAQKMGILPIIIDTENNLGIKRLVNMGFDMKNDFYIMIDNEYLLENFGKKHDKNRKQAAIEDMAECIHYFIDLQENGELPYDLLFAVDSIGTLDCIKSVNAQEKDSNNNNMWNAGALASSMKYLLNNRIPNSRKINKLYTNTFIAVQKIWFDSMQGAGCIRHSGGDAVYSASRYILHFGGTQSHGTSRVIGVCRSREVVIGIKVKIYIAKNHIDGELGGISLNGEIISTPHGFIGIDKEDIDKYKREYIQYFRDVLGNDVNENEIETKFVEIKDNEKIDFNSNFENE